MLRRGISSIMAVVVLTLGVLVGAAMFASQSLDRASRSVSVLDDPMIETATVDLVNIGTSYIVGVHASLQGDIPPGARLCVSIIERDASGKWGIDKLFCERVDGPGEYSVLSDRTYSIVNVEWIFVTLETRGGGVLDTVKPLVRTS